MREGRGERGREGGRGEGGKVSPQKDQLTQSGAHRQSSQEASQDPQQRQRGHSEDGEAVGSDELQ